MKDDSEFTNGGPGDPPYLVTTQITPKPAAKKMCKECPLAKSSLPGYLGGYTADQYLSILHSDAWIACHMSAGFQERDIAKQRGCTGVAHYRANVSKMPRSPTAADDVTTLGKSDEAFEKPSEFYLHHQNAKGANT